MNPHRGRAHRRQRSRRELEGQADDVAHALNRERHGDAQVTSTEVPEHVRRPVEEWAHVDLAGVRIRPAGLPAGAPPDAVAATDGDDVFVRHGLDRVPAELAHGVLLHELAHVAQQREGADGDVLQAPRGRMQYSSCFSSSKSRGEKALDKLKAGDPISAGEATDALDGYSAASDAQRDKLVDDFHAIGRANSAVRRLLDAVTPEERTKRMDIIRDLLDRVQAHASRAAFGGDDDAVAKKQGDWMEAQAQADATAAAEADAKAKGLKGPVVVAPSDVAKAHEKTVAKNTLPPAKTNRWTALDAAGKKSWDDRAAKAIKAVVALGRAKAPHLKLMESDIDWDPATIEGYPNAIFSLSGRPFTVGMLFVEAAEANPEYVIGSVFHEIYGHPEFGEQDSYEWKTYDRAVTKHFPSYTKPANRHDERLLYDYLGTEIYAEMREFEYSKPVSAADSAKGITSSDEPKADIDYKVKKISQVFEPSVAKALVIGLYERFRVDPRIIPAALALYVSAVDKYFPKALTK